MSAYGAVLAAGLGTFVMRATMLVVLAGRELPRWLARAVSRVGPAAVGALVVASLPGGRAADAITVAACVAGFLAVRRTGRVALALAVGFPVVWVLHALS